MLNRLHALPLVLALAFAPSLITTSAAAQDKDGARFRGGVNGAIGGLFGSKDQLSYSGFLGGVNGNLGVQINDLIGVYAVPHLAFGSVSAKVETLGASASKADGWLAFATTAVVDFTFIDQIFVGAGGGFAAHSPTCTNCKGGTGGVMHLRFGG